MEYRDELEETKDRLNKISPSFCAAKWTQVTLHLESGENHSCHHPKPHLTPLDELIDNPSALHNSKFKMLRRKEMMDGIKPSECSYCWSVEDLNKPNVFSDRVLKSWEVWSKPFISQIVNDPFDLKFFPRYLELSFSNVCNLKCSYCSANYSSSWKNEIDKFGNYSTFAGQLTNEIWDEDGNPYIRAFWQWWPEVKGNLKVLRITGGEPLLSKNTFRLLSELQKEQHHELEFAVNSNLSVSHSIVQKFAKELKQTHELSKLKKITMYVSLESVKDKAEYIRFGLDYNLFMQNLEYLLAECPFLSIDIMSTFNLLSVTSYLDFLKVIFALNKKWSSRDRPKPLWVDISHLKSPEYLSITTLPYSFEHYFLEIRKFIYSNRKNYENKINYGFGRLELLKFDRVYEVFMSQRTDSVVKDDRRRFYMFIAEHDKRRKVNFLKVFPEYGDFFDECRMVFSFGDDVPWLERKKFEYRRVKRKLISFFMKVYCTIRKIKS